MAPKKPEAKKPTATLNVELTADLSVEYCTKVAKLIENVTMRKWAIDLTLVKEIADMTEAILNKLEAK